MRNMRRGCSSIKQNYECAFSEDCATLVILKFLLQFYVSSPRPIRFSLWLLLVIAANLFDSPVSAAEFTDVPGTNTIKDTAPVSENSRPSEQTNAASTGPSWRLVRSTGPNGEPGASAILHTIDFERSDPRLAGLMLQCGKQNIEIIIVVVEPFPPRARPQVTLRTSGQVFQFEGSIISTGAGILLPSDATVSLLGPWRSASELEIKVADRETVLDGVVPLSGLSTALDSLNAECVLK
ncbi:hypothetical protein QEV83_05220 [Methylocapsa sp. D3K7]|uniref:hypothetical protein n=1 Tax=Methylocapsa sp. D3K7 TaxID=3041435 RepID=UPI00244E6395|nr:hypothetical protein [Methylocapsa sp. D3K7]WGJ15665.1 hypothetical protein QEV83_05220 [Methylocapsa sp. D3K7]